MIVGECPNCERGQVVKGRCLDCGHVLPQSATRGPSGRVSLTCASCGGLVDAEGKCLTGNGYPVDAICQTACPVCRLRLDWSGACQHCHGSRTSEDKSTWTVPGDRYDLDDGHWRLMAPGPRPIYLPTRDEWARLRKALSVVSGKPLCVPRLPAAGRSGASPTPRTGVT